MTDEKEREKRDSFVVYRSFVETIDQLPAAKRWPAMKALALYAMDHIEPDMDKMGLAGIVFQMARPQIDANNKRFENGKKGGRKTKTKPKPNQNGTKTKPKRNQNGTKTEPNVNVNGNGNGLDPLIGSKPFTAHDPARDGGGPVGADEVKETINRLKAKGAGL